MNIGKSVRVAMAKRDIKPKELAERMSASRQYIGQLMKAEAVGVGTLSKLCEVFGMKVSEFVALGEE